MTRTGLTVVAAIALATSIAAQEPAKKSGPPKKDPNHVTVTGCLSGGEQANTYILTAKPDALTAGVNAATAGAVPTINYLLQGGLDFKAHVGHEVEVVGRVDDKSTAKKTEAKKKTEQPAATKGVDPEVKVTERARIEVRPLRVESVRMVSETCQAAKQ
jgi:hypothetical protein